jgi:hypothetical protein
MASKFTEVFHTPEAEEFSSRNVSLEDILEETRRRSSSSGESTSSSGSSSPQDSQQQSTSNTSPSTAIKKLRRLTGGATKTYR